MNYTLALLICVLCQPTYSLAGTGKQPEYDSVSIGYIPSQGGHHKGEPGVVHEAKTLAHHKNKEIEKFYVALSGLAAQGTKSNAREFHGATHYIDAEYQGQRVRLFFDGDSRLKKFLSYEQKWKVLHGDISAYLNQVQFKQAN